MKDASQVTFGDYVRQARKAKGWTQEDLETRSGVSRATLSRWERNQLNEAPGAEHVRAVCRALDLDPRRAAVILGYLTVEEVEDTRPHLPKDVEEILTMLQDPALPDGERARLHGYLKYQLDLLRQQAG